MVRFHHFVPTLPVVALLFLFSVFCLDSVASFSDLLLSGDDVDDSAPVPSESAPPPPLLAVLAERPRHPGDGGGAGPLGDGSGGRGRRLGSPSTRRLKEA